MAKKIIPFIVFILCQTIILKLAFWQVERLAWKQDIIAALDIAYAQPATDLTFNDALQQTIQQQEIFFQRGTIHGQYLQDKSIKVGPRQRNGTNGHHITSLFQLNKGPIITINRGWVSEGASINTAPNTKNAILTGILRHPSAIHSMTPSNVPAQNLWFSLNISELEKHWDTHNLPSAVFYIENESPASSHMDAPQPFTTQWYPRNEHFQYMIFWFSMSLILTLIAAISLYALRKKPSSKT